MRKRKTIILQVLAGAVAGDAILPALNTIAQAADTVVVRLAETLLRAASNDGEGGDGEGGTRGRLDADQNELREDGVLDVSAFPAPSIEEQSVLVDLGRTAFKVRSLLTFLTLDWTRFCKFNCTDHAAFFSTSICLPSTPHACLLCRRSALIISGIEAS